jgi:two-component sensor histidine kinase
MDERDAPDAMSLSDVRHRTANIFQLLTTLGRLRAQRSEDGEARRQVEWLLDAIGALGVLQHRLLRPEGGDFALFLSDMRPLWERRVGGRAIAIEVKADPVVLQEQTAAAMAMIVQELVVNAIGHGFPDGRAGVVRVEVIRLEEGRARLSVSDDGVGYDPAAVDPRRLGLWLVAGLADQVKGVLTTTREAGVSARLDFAAV